MARYATPEKEYRCPRCSRYTIFRHLKRYYSNIICPNCGQSMGSFGVRIYEDIYTIGFIETDPPTRYEWDRKEIENLEVIDMFGYLKGLDDAEGVHE